MEHFQAREGGRARHAWIAMLLLVAAVSSCGGEPDGSAASDAGAAPDTGGAPATLADTTPRGGPAAAPADTMAATAPSSPDSTEWTIGVLTGSSTLDGGPPPVPVLTGLRRGVHPEYERVTFELEGAAGLPGYRIEYVDRPLHDCGSGEPTYPVGDAWLEIRLEPAAAHTEEGRPTLGARDLPIDQPLLQRVYRTCDFEAVVTHVLALSEPNPFRVMRLADPPRMVVDVQR